jgi:hypothetical protein
MEMVETTSGSLQNPIVLTQSHKIKTPGTQGNDRVNASIRENVTNSNTGLPFTGSISVQISIPKDPSWTEAKTKDLLSQMASFLGAAGAYGTSGSPVSGATDTSLYPNSLAKALFVGG